MKKLLSLFLALAMIVSVVPALAEPAEAGAAEAAGCAAGASDGSVRLSLSQDGSRSIAAATST